MINRRRFLQTAPLIGFAPTIPAFLARTAGAADASADRRVLVVIQLDGGNDGINTVVPVGDDGYAKNRVKLRLDAKRLHKLDDNVSLHQSMSGFAGLWNDGELAVLQGVSYPNPSRSHAVSMSIWHSARPGDREQRDYGWLGRTLDRTDRVKGGADAVFAADRAKPLALKGRKCRVAEFTRIDDLTLSAPATVAKDDSAGGGGLEQFLTRSTLDAYATSRQLDELKNANDEDYGYPNSDLGQRLKMVAKLLTAGWPSRVYYTVQPGYDTHQAQLFQHSRLLRDLSDSVAAFQKDLKASKLDERVITLCFSEFGRRVAENGSAGTDHGTAGPVFVVGQSVKGGVFGGTPSLIDLDDDNLKTSLDFRCAYATVIDRWLGADSTAVLEGKFDPLPFLPG